MSRELYYKDVLLLPRMAMVNSRSEVDVSQKLGDFTFKLPVMPANMKTIIDLDLAKWLSENGYFYVMHRFGVDIVDFAKRIKTVGQGFISISLGVNEDSYDVLSKLNYLELLPQFVTIDVAHGHCPKMQQMIEHITKTFPEIFIIAGNVCTPEAVADLTSWGADAVKVGIGGGAVCTTKLQTGFSRPQFSCVLECAKGAIVPIIADGGIQECGDIAKALVAGASWIMAGKLFAGYNESAGRLLIRTDGTKFKEYFGSASEHNKEAKEFVEGCRTEVPLRGPIADRFKEIEQALRSSVSYAGGNTLDAFLQVKWVAC